MMTQIGVQNETHCQRENQMHLFRSIVIGKGVGGICEGSRPDLGAGIPSTALGSEIQQSVCAQRQLFLNRSAHTAEPSQHTHMRHGTSPAEPGVCPLYFPSSATAAPGRMSLVPEVQRYTGRDSTISVIGMKKPFRDFP